jgi:serine/threonine-protein kinase
MSADLLRRAEAIYFEVERLPDRERAAAARRRCGGDERLWAEVRSLLNHAEVPEAFLGAPALSAGVLSAAAAEAWDHAAAEDRLEGTMLGPWRLVRRLASGGMGTVYEGVRADGAFEQRVAVKVVKRGMDSEEILERFRVERQALASLAHPNIARLFDGGMTADGRPYLVMEYVDGYPIDEYCDREGLSIPERLRLFEKVCDAVHAAHRHLVVHRDLKPGNILVGVDGEPRLLDFGIAKVLRADEGSEGTAQTAPEQRRLTPEYASPEQIEGRAITTATDVYSLGVILYEVLTGSRPYAFETRTTREIERVVCHQDPPAPSAAVQGVGASRTGRADGEAASAPGGARAAARVRRQLRGDLDNIVLMAMRKEPERRYSSAEQMGQDIRRHLAGLPVMARRDTMAYRAVKFVRRHTVGVGAAAALALSVVLGAAGFAWQARRAAEQRDAAYVARDQAEATTEFLVDMLSSVDPEATGHEVTVRDLLEQMSRRIGTDFEPKPLVKAALMASIGSAYVGLGDYDRAEPFLARSLEIRRGLLGDDHHDVAEGMISMARHRYATNRLDEAEALLRRALEVHQRHRGLENEDTARVMNDLGAVLRAGGKLDEAERTHREALRIRRRLHGDESLPVAESLNNLANVLRQRGDLAGADGAMSESLRIRRRLLPADHGLVAQSVANMAILATMRGDAARAEALFREAIPLEERAFGADHPGVAATRVSFGSLLHSQGRSEEALEHLQAAYRIRAARLPAGDARTIAAQASLARCLLSMGRAEEALAHARQVVAVLEGAGGPAAARLEEARELVRACEAAANARAAGSVPR